MLSIRIQVSVLLGSLLSLAAPELARADEPPPPPPPATEAPSASHFGDAGQFALQLNDGLTVSGGDLLAGPQIQANYFIAPHLSLGLMAGVNYYSSSQLDNDAQHELTFRVGPRVGYDLPISELVSFWPQVGVDFRLDHETLDTADLTEGTTGFAAPSTSSTTTAFAFTAVAPIVLHPTKGFFVGAGPSFYTEFTNKTSSGGSSMDNSKLTAVGLMATIGGAF